MELGDIYFYPDTPNVREYGDFKVSGVFMIYLGKRGLQPLEVGKTPAQTEYKEFQYNTYKQ